MFSVEVVLAAEAKQHQQKSQRKHPAKKKLSYQPKTKQKKSQPEGQHQKKTQAKGQRKKTQEKGKSRNCTVCKQPLKGHKFNTSCPKNKKRFFCMNTVLLVFLANLLDIYTTVTYRLE